MSNATPFCPNCGTPLVLNRQGEFNPWLCPNGHGLAATISEAYERAQEDELDELWKLAKSGSASDRACPMCEQPMVVVDLAWDSDEVFEGLPGDGPDEGTERLEVCARDQVIWFDGGELDALPADLPDAEPSDAELARIDEITQTFGAQVEAAGQARIDHTVTERIYDRLMGNRAVRNHLGRRVKSN